jgi:hypothetical protein
LNHHALKDWPESWPFSCSEGCLTALKQINKEEKKQRSKETMND